MTLIAGLLIAVTAALAGFLAGRLQRAHLNQRNPQIRRAIERAHAIVKEFYRLSDDVRIALGSHRKHVAHFEVQLRSLSNSPDNPSWVNLAVEAENLLKPTLSLSAQVAHVYDSIRQQTHLLTALTEMRTDPLTGLRNRRALDEAVQSRLAMLDRYANAFSVAVFDVDHFKQVNDQHGHLEGDRILQEVARVLEATARDTDIVARFGGEEFVAVMPETPFAGACIFAERARAAVHQQLQVTISGGVTEATSSDDTRRLLSRADSAMYAAKEAGRNLVCKLAASETTPQPLPQRPLEPLKSSESNSLVAPPQSTASAAASAIDSDEQVAPDPTLNASGAIGPIDAIAPIESPARR